MIPNHWHLSTLGDISTLCTGNSINKKLKLEKYYGQTSGITYIATKDIDFDNTINYDTNIKIPESDDYKIAPANTALLCIEGGSAGRKIGFTNQPVCFVNKLCAFITTTVHSKFIYYYLQTLDFIKQFNDRKHGLIGGVPLKDLSSIEIPVPPLDEQQKIVEIIDSLFEKLNRARVLAQNVIDNYELRFLVILHRAINGKLTNSNTNNWQETILKDLLFPMQSVKPDGEYLKYIDIESIDNTNQKIREAKIIKTEEASSRASRRLEKYNVLFSLVRPYLRNIAIVEEEYKDCIASTGFYVCRCKEDILPKYLYNVLRSKYAIDYYQQFIKGFNSPSIRTREFLSLEVKLPTIEEQKEIVRILDNLLSKEQRAKEIAEQILQEIDLLKKTILARAFRGKFYLRYK